MTLTQYLIGTCLGCKKCLYCGSELSIRKKMCTCNKTIKPSKKNRTDKVKVAYSRVSTPNLPLEQLQYIQNSVTHFKYSLDFNTKFNFTLCSTCHSTFQRLKSTTGTNSSNNLDNDKSNNDSTNLEEFDNECEHGISEKSETEQIISFNLIVKPFTGPPLLSKWLEVEVLLLDDIFADVHYYTGKLTGNKEIMHSDYSVSFKPEKTGGAGAQLVDIQDYKRFLSDYKKLLDKKKNIVILVSLKKEKQKQKRKVNFVFYLCIEKLFLIVFIFRKFYQILKNQKMSVSSYVKKKCSTKSG